LANLIAPRQLQPQGMAEDGIDRRGIRESLGDRGLEHVAVHPGQLGAEDAVLRELVDNPREKRAEIIRRGPNLLVKPLVLNAERKLEKLRGLATARRLEAITEVVGAAAHGEGDEKGCPNVGCQGCCERFAHVFVTIR